MKVLVASLCLVLAAACTAEPAPVDTAGRPHRTKNPRPTVTKTGNLTDVPVEMLMWVKGHRLAGYDPDTGRDKGLRGVPSADVVLSPDGTRIAIVVDRQPGGDPEGYGDPYIRVSGLTDDGGTTELGPGRSPRWSADGTELAAITDTGVVTYDLDGDSTQVLAGNGWTILGWSDDQVAAVGQGTTVLANSEGSTDLGFEPSVIWGVSPVEETVVSVASEQPEIVHGDEVIPVAIDGGMADGAWSPNGRHIVVVQVGDGPSRAVLVDTTTGAATEIAEGQGAQGNVVWDGDSERFAFVRVDPDDKLKLQAVVCDVQGPCDPGFSWTRGVVLLGFAVI
jgi:hypothetical protein